MPAILLDPWLLGLISDEEDAESYIERLTDISDSARGVLKFEVSAEASSLLEADGIYPLSQPLPPALWPQRSDVFKIVTFLCDKLPKIEDSGVADVLAEHVQLTPELSPGSSENHQLHLYRLATFATVLAHMPSMSERALLTKAAIAARHRCRADVLIVESDRVDTPACQTLETDLACGSTPHDVLSSLGAESFDQPEELLMAICLSHSMRENIKNNTVCATGWTAGSHFIDSARQCNLFAQKSKLNALIRTCVDVLLSENLQDTHWLRVSAGAAAAQVTRSSDGARAWRMDIDHELHLHYWITSNGPEFSNVVMHRTMEIFED